MRRCFVFEGSESLAWHNNIYRAFNLSSSILEREVLSFRSEIKLLELLGLTPSQPSRDLVPFSAFLDFSAKYEEPAVAEGFSEIVKVQWRFQGSEEERERWNAWLQIDGK